MNVDATDRRDEEPARADRPAIDPGPARWTRAPGPAMDRLVDPPMSTTGSSTCSTTSAGADRESMCPARTRIGPSLRLDRAGARADRGSMCPAPGAGRADASPERGWQMGYPERGASPDRVSLERGTPNGGWAGWPGSPERRVFRSGGAGRRRRAPERPVFVSEPGRFSFSPESAVFVAVASRARTHARN